ncbi:MAG: bifunctional phosphopantothenoylcysteine decarboxylase/phosphopantothenate--cysteine ligase CoaBC [Vicingaceae bacterium]
MLRGKNVLLAISAGIAAYKSAYLCRALIKKGAKVKVLMTPQSTHFIAPLTLSTLSKNPVTVEYFNSENGEWNNHVELAKWADFFLLAPATANTLGKMANGICDNVLLATYFSMEKPVYFAPAMDLDMYQHPAIKANINKLVEYGNRFIPAESGELASGLEGEGRMAEPDQIIERLEAEGQGKLQSKKLLITAGPTFEPLDPVRFIGNRSSGKMGYAIAQEAINRGAEVTLVSGPSDLAKPKGAMVIEVETAKQMFEAVKANFKAQDCLIMSAAVSDYTPKVVAAQKMKKKTDELTLELQKTDDILKFVGDNKRNDQFLVGFALETENEETNAKQKLEKKRLDLIVLNSLQDKGAGFSHDTNKVTFIDKDNNKVAFELKEKQQVAKDLFSELEKRWLD